MPTFTRRRLQLMLDELGNLVEHHKLKDVRNRLESKRTEQALPAEVELGVIWALSKLGDVEVEPEWFGTGRPDVYTEHLFDGQPCAVEITAMSDGRLSQEDDMQRLASRLVQTANVLKKGSGKYLHFHFLEERGYTGAGYVRRRLVDSDFVPSRASIDRLADWLARAGPREDLRIVQDSTHVEVSWHATPQSSLGNYSCTMPAESYSLVDNPLYETLRQKARQLYSEQFTGLRCVVVADAGSRLLRESSQRLRSIGTVSASDIIEYFLSRSDAAVDVVVVLNVVKRSARHGAPWSQGNQGNPGNQIAELESTRWSARAWIRPGLEVSTVGIDQMVSLLPRARFTGRQARSLQQQAAYRHDARGWYVPTTMHSSEHGMSIRISARALIELLAGRITLEQFQHFTGLDKTPTSPNIFAHRLDQGDVIRAVRLKDAGVDQDDDWLEFELERDPAAAPLELKHPSPDPI